MTTLLDAPAAHAVSNPARITPLLIPRQRCTTPVETVAKPSWDVPGRTALLIDLDNIAIHNGSSLRTRKVAKLINAALHTTGQVDYCLAVAPQDSVQRYGAELAAANVRWALVDPTPNAADYLILATAEDLQAKGFTRFWVASADHAFAPLAQRYPTRVIVREGQPVSRSLTRHALSITEL